MLVVVFLRESRQYSVIPEEFIYELNEKKLKNRGMNRNQDHLIYFSKAVFEQLKRNERVTQEPKFHLPISKEYPLRQNINECCFIARMIRFEDTFEEAIACTKRLRKQLPPIYNPARINERPIPPVEIPTETVANGEEEEEEEENINVNSDQSGVSTEQIENDSTQNIQTNNVSVDANNSLEDVKPVLAVDDEDIIAFDNLFNYDGRDSAEIDPLTSNDANEEKNHSNALENVIVERNNSSLAAIRVESTRDHNMQTVENVIQYENAPENIEQNRGEIFTKETGNGENAEVNNDEAHKEEEEKRIANIATNVQTVLLYGETVIVDDDLEFIHLPDQILRAMEYLPTFQVKAEDELCGNRPFKQNDNGDRAFMIPSKGDEFDEIWLTAHAVNGLVKLNKKKPGEHFDSIFLKALLIGLCTLKAIKENEPIADGILEVIKDLFQWRIREADNRLHSFDELLKTALDGIRMNNFQS